MKDWPWGFIVSLVLAFGIGVTVGHRATMGPAHFEPPAAAAVLPATPASPHGGVILAREPERAAAPAQAIPKGYTVRRVGRVTIKPSASPVDMQVAADAAAKPDRPPMTLDLTVADAPDGGQRILASSPDGEVIGGFDSPRVLMAVPATHRWAAGPAYNPVSGRFGVWLDRDIWRARVGAQLLQQEDGRIEPWLKVGFNF